MTKYAALDVSQELTAVCIVDETGRITAEKGQFGTFPLDPQSALVNSFLTATVEGGREWDGRVRSPRWAWEPAEEPAA